jgi:H+/Cl- antiporter ClcA
MLSLSHRLRLLLRNPKISVRIWLYRIMFWGGAVLVSLSAMLFEKGSTMGNHLFRQALALHSLLALVITPLGFVGVLWLTRRLFPGAQGSGIPQTIAALKIEAPEERHKLLSLRVAAGKLLLTSLGLCCGASVGREGPTVQIGAAIMLTLGRWIRLPIPKLEQMLILAGGAAGISAAFNTPLAGVVFAIEEMARSFEERNSGTVLTTVIISGFVSMAVVGNYTYFGRTDAVVSLAQGWQAILVCGLGGGILGGLFARILMAISSGLPGRVGIWTQSHPYFFALACGFGLALLGLLSGDSVYGTGYEEARGLIEGKHILPASFGLLKMLASILSYASGIPGGIFAPSLAVGAGLGANMQGLMPLVPVGALCILGMVSYFTGVVQAPITAVVIVMEMTDDQSLTLPLMAAALLAFGVSRLVCPKPFYKTMAQGFIAAAKPAA